jgi:RNA binding exosome subunit
MQVHFIELSVFSTPEDNLGKVEQGFASFIPFDPVKEKVAITRLNAEGFNDRQIVIIKTSLTKQRHISAFLGSLKERLSQDQKELITGQKDKRVDENLYLFARFDKTKLVDEGRLWLTDSGNCYHLKIALAPFPRKREHALKIVDELFSPCQ